MSTKINNRRNKDGEITRVEIRYATKFGSKYICSVRPEDVPVVRAVLERVI